MATPHQPTPGQRARRELFTRLIHQNAHGSEDQLRRPPDFSTPQTPATSTAAVKPDSVIVLTDQLLSSPTAPRDAIPGGVIVEADAVRVT